MKQKQTVKLSNLSIHVLRLLQSDPISFSLPYSQNANLTL